MTHQGTKVRFGPSEGCVFLRRSLPLNLVVEPSREAVWCSNDSQTGHAGCWCWPRRRRACSTTASSAPSTSCWASSTRVRASRPRRWSRWASPSRPCARRSRRRSARPGTAPTGSPPFTPARQEGARALAARGAAARPQLHRHRAHAPRPGARGRGRRRPGLVSLGADLARVRQQVIQLLSGYQGKEPVGAGPGSQPRTTSRPARPVLDQFGRNLTQLARDGKLDPVIGREQGDRAGHAGPVAAHQEQPGPHRRARRGQDGHRRGPGPAHRGQRRARDAEGQAALHPRPRRPGGRAAATAATSRSA